MPPDPVVYFVDRSLGKHAVPDALRRAGATVELHDDHFAADTPDEVWIEEVAARGWTILTKDSRIRYRPLEHEAVRASRAGLFVLTAGSVSGTEMAEIFVHHLARMERIALSRPRPFIARVTRSRVTVERLRP